jgi:kynurenine formamidase
MLRRTSVVAVALALTASVAYLAGSAASSGAVGGGGGLPGVSNVVFLSHVNNPNVVPGFPGDPAFTLTTAFTVPADGYYLQYVKEGEHTGSHYSAPCHFHVQARCAEDLAAGDFVLPAVVVDVRAQVAADVDYHVSVGT